MKAKAIVVLATVMLCIAGMANARPYTVIGAGGHSCGTWLTQAGSIDERGWLLGFVSSYNAWMLQTDEDVSRSTDALGMFAWVTNYCRSHPLDRITDAGMALILELNRRSGAH
jgi:hypothetical protein